MSIWVRASARPWINFATSCRDGARDSRCMPSLTRQHPHAKARIAVAIFSAMAKDEETVASSLSLASSEGEAFTTERSSSSSRPDKGKQRAAVQDGEAAAALEASSARTTPRSLHAVAGGWVPCCHVDSLPAS